MAVGTDAIEVYEGEDVTVVATIGTPADVTGFTFAFLVKQLATSTGAALYTGSCAVTGVQQVTVTCADVDLTGGTYVYGLRRTDASGGEMQYAQGVFTVISSVNVTH